MQSGLPDCQTPPSESVLTRVPALVAAKHSAAIVNCRFWHDVTLADEALDEFNLFNVRTPRALAYPLD